MKTPPTKVETNASRHAKFEGSKFVNVTPQITLGCISPDARTCLDSVMDEWRGHKASLRKLHGKHYRPGEYGFAYWLIRWSGLVQPTELSVSRGVDTNTADLNPK